MAWLTIILTSLFAAISTAGLILDRVVEQNLRSQVAAVEQLAVRIDNAPSFQALPGKVERVRLASRGLQPVPDFRIAAIDLETDPLHVDLQKLQQGGEVSLTSALRQPAQGAVRLVLTEADLNRAFQSPKIKGQLQQLLNRFLPQREGEPAPAFEILDLHLECLTGNRLRAQIRLQPSQTEPASQPTEVELEVGFQVIAGRSLQLVEPKGKINGRRLSTKLLQGFAEGLLEVLDLRRLEAQGITARLLQFSITEETIELAAFARIEPSP